MKTAISLLLAYLVIHTAQAKFNIPTEQPTADAESAKVTYFKPSDVAYGINLPD